MMNMKDGNCSYAQNIDIRFLKLYSADFLGGHLKSKRLPPDFAGGQWLDPSQDGDEISSFKTKESIRQLIIFKN